MGGYGGADDMKSHMDYESNHGFHTERYIQTDTGVFTCHNIVKDFEGLTDKKI